LHSTQSEPALAMMGGMAAVGLAYVHRPIRK
jgi:hypothetical protein